MNRSPYASNLSAPTPLTCENCSPVTGLIRTMSRSVFIGKDDIRGFTEFAGDVKPQRTQFGEQFLVSVARHIRSHSLRACGRRFCTFRSVLPFDLFDFIMKIRRDRFRRTFTEANDRHGTFRNGKKTIRRHLAEHVTNLRLRSRAQHAVRRQIGRMKIVQILRFRSSQHFDDLPRTDLLVHVMHAAADGPRDIRDVNGFKRVPAVRASSHACAVITDGRSPGLTENTWSYTRADNPWYGNNRSWR